MWCSPNTIFLSSFSIRFMSSFLNDFLEIWFVYVQSQNKEYESQFQRINHCRWWKEQGWSGVLCLEITVHAYPRFRKCCSQLFYMQIFNNLFDVVYQGIRGQEIIIYWLNSIYIETIEKQYTYYKHLACRGLCLFVVCLGMATFLGECGEMWMDRVRKDTVQRKNVHCSVDTGLNLNKEGTSEMGRANIE